MEHLLSRARHVRRLAAAGSYPRLPEGADVESRAALPEVKATPGRPDIHALLRQICAEHGSEQEIGVVAAGVLLPLACMHVFLNVP
jgi:hypothetical protein